MKIVKIYLITILLSITTLSISAMDIFDAKSDVESEIKATEERINKLIKNQKFDKINALILRLIINDKHDLLFQQNT